MTASKLLMRSWETVVALQPPQTSVRLFPFMHVLTPS
jgi:hypothetical protein